MGSAICEHLARSGHRVAIADLDGEAAERTAAELRATGAIATAGQVDVADRSAVDRVLDEVRAEFGPIEILVTSAAVADFVAFEEITAEDWSRTMEVNLTGTFNCLQAAVTDMAAGGWGRIVTISSAAGQTGSSRQGHYSASKGGVIALTKAVALEYAKRGITANTIPPFIVDTPMLRGAQEGKFLPPADVLAKMVPAGRLGTGDDIGAMCAYLCSDAAGYITGQVIGVNGGAVL
jgi:NAD(P)-dependent dehydrogenase (short-subunit alcohol dehydrogenase family)